MPAVFAIIISLFAFLGLTELLLRLVDPIGISYFYENDRYFSILKPNDRYAYIHPSHYRGKFQGEDIIINSHGFRGPEYTIEKPKNTTRILIVGDSVVLGWGAPQNAIFPIKLQERFAQSGRQIEIIPMGVSSWNTRNQFEYLKSNGMQLNPDIVLLMIVPNDVVPKENGYTEIRKELLFKTATPVEKKSEESLKLHLWNLWKTGGKYLYTIKYIQYFGKISAQDKTFSQLTEESPSWQDAKLALEGIVKLCKERNIGLIVYLYGSTQTIESNTSLKLYDQYLKSKNIQTHSLPDALFAESKYRISIADGHATALGHELITNELYNSLRAALTHTAK